MHAKKIILICFACILLCCCYTSTRVEPTVLEYQRQIDYLEERLRNRDRAIESCIRELNTISTRSEAMGGDIEDIIREFDLYQSAVERLLQAAGYRENKEQVNE